MPIGRSDLYNYCENHDGLKSVIFLINSEDVIIPITNVQRLIIDNSHLELDLYKSEFRLFNTKTIHLETNGSL